MRHLYLLLILVLLPLAVSCGGGSGSGVILPTLTVDWPVLSRDVAAPASAQSVGIALNNVNGGNAFIFNRATNPAANNQTYTITTPVSPGVYTVSLTFYSLENGTGSIVGVANGTAQLSASAVSLGNFTMTGSVASVVVLEPPVEGNYVISGSGSTAAYTTTPQDVTTYQFVTVGATVQLIAGAYDASGNNLIVAPSGITWALVLATPSFTLTTDGHATGVTVGTGEVTATIDGIVSNSQAINVTNPPAVAGCTNATYEPNYAQEIANASANGTDTTIQSTYGSLGGKSLLHWSSFPVTVQVTQNAYLTANLITQLQTALATWTSATGGGVTFSQFSGTGTPDITITFEPATTISGSQDGTVGLTTATPSASNPTLISSVQIQVASDLTDNYQTLDCICHEFGHGLGIEGHSATNQDLMYPYLNNDYAPTTDDVNTLFTAYCGSFPGGTRGPRPAPGKNKIVIRN